MLRSRRAAQTGRLAGDGLVAVCDLRSFGICPSTDDSLVFEAVGAEGEGLAARKAAAVQHGHGPILLHFSNNMHLVCT